MNTCKTDLNYVQLIYLLFIQNAGISNQVKNTKILKAENATFNCMSLIFRNDDKITLKPYMEAVMINLHIINKTHQ